MLIFYNVFITDLDVQLLASDLTMSLDDSGTLCADLAATPGSYTYFQISDGINFEIVKVTGCTGPLIDIERGQGDTDAANFAAGTCVAFRLNDVVLSDYICSLSCQDEEDIVCNIVTGAPGFIELSRDGCEMTVDFVPYTAGVGIDITDNDISTDLCNLDPTSELDNTANFIICKNGVPWQVNFAVLVEEIGACGEGAAAPGVQSVVGGTGINVTGTAEVPIVNMDEVLVGGGSFLGITFNNLGQAIVVPGTDPLIPVALPDGNYDPANITVAGGLITAISTSTSFGVVSVSQTVGASVTVDNTDPNNPLIELPDSTLVPGTYSGFTFDDKGRATAFVAPPDAITSITTPIGSRLTITGPVAGVVDIDHDDSGVGAGIYNGITVDAKGHVVSVTGSGVSRWVGTAASVASLTENLTATNVGATMTLTFTIPTSNPLYHVMASDDAGTQFPVTSRGAGVFDIDTTGVVGLVYVTAIG
jgi:hypothetical protein